MNISGAGMLKHAPNKSNAVKLVEFLLTAEAQNHIVNNTFEYPMISGVSANDLVPGKDMSFKQDNKTSVKTYGATSTTNITTRVRRHKRSGTASRSIRRPE